MRIKEVKGEDESQLELKIASLRCTCTNMKVGTVSEKELVNVCISSAL